MTDLKRGSFYGEPQNVSYTTHGGSKSRTGELVALAPDYSRVKEEGSGRMLSVLTKNIRPIEEPEEKSFPTSVDLTEFKKGGWVRAWSFRNGGYIDVVGPIEDDGSGDLYVVGVGYLNVAAENLNNMNWTIQSYPQVTAEETVAELREILG
jgi:hypothetical protein